MKIEVLHIEKCPSWVEASELLQEALLAAGHVGTTISYRLIETAKDAGSVPFAGSPTITLNGRDLFPGAEVTTELACRIYWTPAGLSGSPTAEQFREAILSYDR